ncbi:NOP protein chaperone 1 isoform X1 [Trichechus manatus latirostris]|uniref:NOP protein chaperone 1 isoform X1 n=1 Tax=Trichechus manatus latirostris TaxID=127582 RepID=A0A2Y9DFQ0_TRIMA|nr:NOP protein chaperone 1 isoform X1 [Trichechus manatus latirostris]
MEVHSKPQPSPSCSSSTAGCSGVSVSKELLTAESGGLGGIWDRLCINSKPNSRKSSNLQTVRIERSPLLDQVQTFLPQMAQANEKLRKEMAAAPPGRFDIENVDETLGKIIQMDVALFEMNQSDSKEEDSSEESSQDSSENSSESEDEEISIPGEITIDNIKLPNSEGGKGKIEVLDSPASKKKKQ